MTQLDKLHGTLTIEGDIINRMYSLSHMFQSTALTGTVWSNNCSELAERSDRLLALVRLEVLHLEASKRHDGARFQRCE